MRPATYGLWPGGRGFLVNGDPKPAADTIRKHLRIYPLAQAAHPPVTKFSNVSGVLNTVHANNSTSMRRSMRLSKRSRLRRLTRKHWDYLPPSASRKASPSRPMNA
jgi:hypothetical protein